MSHALTPEVVHFYDDELVAIQTADGAIFILFTKLCDNLGLNHRPQLLRVQRHDILVKGLIKINVDTAGGPQEVQCLKLSLLPLWLAGLQVNRVKAEIQDKLAAYQNEAADVLWNAFRSQIVVDEPVDDLSISTDAELAQLHQIADLGRAITRMAEEQVELRRRMDTAARAFQGMRRDITDVQVRLDILEDRVSPASRISDAQAAEVSNRVKALAELLTTKDTSKNHYQAIFAELYRRFSVSSYKLIQQVQYDDVLTFLKNWREQCATE